MAGLAFVTSRWINDAILESVMKSVGWSAAFFGEGYAAVQRSRVRVSLAISLMGALVLLIYLLLPFLGKGGF